MPTKDSLYSDLTMEISSVLFYDILLKATPQIEVAALELVITKDIKDMKLPLDVLMYIQIYQKLLMHFITQFFCTSLSVMQSHWSY